LNTKRKNLKKKGKDFSKLCPGIFPPQET